MDSSSLGGADQISAGAAKRLLEAGADPDATTGGDWMDPPSHCGAGEDSTGTWQGVCWKPVPTQTLELLMTGGPPSTIVARKEFHRSGKAFAGSRC